MKVHKWKDVEKKFFTPERIRASDARVERDLMEMNLRVLRETLGMTQFDVAKVADMTQGELSRAERREDHLVSSLRRIIHALGGEIEVTAVFGDKRIKLDGV